MTISFETAARLRDAGFNDWEIQRLSEASTPAGRDQPLVDLDSPVWQRVLLSRRDWIGDKKDRGWSPEEIDRNIMDYYGRDPKRNPFDFLKSEYKPPLRRDYLDAVRNRSQRRIKAALPGYY